MYLKNERDEILSFISLFEQYYCSPLMTEEARDAITKTMLRWIGYWQFISNRCINSREDIYQARRLYYYGEIDFDE